MAEPSVKRFRNSLEGESLFVPAGVAFEGIPEIYRELIDAPHRAFLSDPADVLNALAKRTSFETLSGWLNVLSGSDRFGAIIHYADMFGSIQHELTVCCMQSHRWRFLRLPYAEYAVDRLRHPLNELYRVTDGIVESADAFLTSQFVSFRRLFFNFESSFPIDDSPLSNLAEALAFYQTDTGDYLVADGDDAFAFCHEDCSFHKCGTIFDLLESYLQSDLENTKWNPFPYG